MNSIPTYNVEDEFRKYVRRWVANNVEIIGPAVVTSVENYANQRVVDVQPLLMELEDDGDAIQHPEVFNCPVILPASENGYVSFPVRVGDTVCIGYNKRSSEEMTFGGSTEPVVPVDRRIFGCSDVVVLGYWAQPNKDKRVSPDDFEINFQDTYLRLTTNNDIKWENPSATEELSGDGTKTFTNGSVTVEFNQDGTATITANSTVTINGTVVNPDGSVSFASGATSTPSGDFVTAGGVSLQALHDAYVGHGVGAPAHPPPPV